MLGQGVASAGILVLAATGLLVSNTLTDRGVNVYVARRVSAAVGGVAFLFSVLLLDAGVAITLSVIVTIGVVAVRVWFPQGLRGVQGSLPTQPWVEITFLLSGTACLVIGWGLLADRWLGLRTYWIHGLGRYCLRIVTDQISRRRGRLRLWPQSVMMVTCLAVAARLTPTILGIRDDNWTIVSASLATMAVLNANLG